MPRNSKLAALPLKPADLVLLAVLQDGPRHGYGLSQAIDRRSSGRVKVRPGDLYRVLYRLCQQGLIAAREQAGPEERRRTDYALTDAGRRVLVDEARRLAKLSAEILARSEPHAESAP